LHPEKFERRTIHGPRNSVLFKVSKYRTKDSERKSKYTIARVRYYAQHAPINILWFSFRVRYVAHPLMAYSFNLSKRIPRKLRGSADQTRACWLWNFRDAPHEVRVYSNKTEILNGLAQRVLRVKLDLIPSVFIPIAFFSPGNKKVNLINVLDLWVSKALFKVRYWSPNSEGNTYSCFWNAHVNRNPLLRFIRLAIISSDLRNNRSKPVLDHRPRCCRRSQEKIMFTLYLIPKLIFF